MVRAALRDYNDEAGEYPKSLLVLQSDEASEIVEQDEFSYARNEKSYVLFFIYKPLLSGGSVVCRAYAGFDGWSCGPYN